MESSGCTMPGGSQHCSHVKVLQWNGGQKSLVIGQMGGPGHWKEEEEAKREGEQKINCQHEREGAEVKN